MLTLILTEKRLKGVLGGVLSGAVLLWGGGGGRAKPFSSVREGAKAPSLTEGFAKRTAAPPRLKKNSAQGNRPLSAVS